MFCRLYRAACKKYRRSGLTFSASAHLLAMQGRPAWRDLIDAVARVFGDDQHCETSFRREQGDERCGPGATPAGSFHPAHDGRHISARVCFPRRRIRVNFKPVPAGIPHQPRAVRRRVMGEKVGAVVGYGGSGTAFVFGLTTSQWQVVGVAGGLLIGFLGFAVNVWFAWRRDQREERARGTM